MYNIIGFGIRFIVEEDFKVNWLKFRMDIVEREIVKLFYRKLKSENGKVIKVLEI